MEVEDKDEDLIDEFKNKKNDLIKILEFFIQKNIKFNFKDINNKNIIMYLCNSININIDILKLLINFHFFNINDINKFNFSSSMYLSMNPHVTLEMFIFMIDNNANILHLNNKNISPLIYFYFNKKIDIIDKIYITKYIKNKNIFIDIDFLQSRLISLNKSKNNKFKHKFLSNYYCDLIIDTLKN